MLSGNKVIEMRWDCLWKQLFPQIDKFSFPFYYDFSSTDDFIEQQVWKTQVDLSIFHELMTECADTELLNNGTRYVKITKSSDVNETDESEQREFEEATGGADATADEAIAEPIFLETTVWIQIF